MDSGSSCAKRGSALGAGADAAQVVVAIDARCVAVREGNLHGVVAHDGGSLSARLGLKHRQRWKSGARGRGGGERFFLAAFVVTGSARTFLAQVGEVIVADVAVGPSDIDS